MKVLIIGSGGREHALAWKAAQSPIVDQVIVAPGNAGTAAEPGIRNVGIDTANLDGLLELATREQIDLTIIGPEQPLVAGISDRFEQQGLNCFGPTAAAAQLEGSKRFAKEFLQRNGIPTASYRSFENLDEARGYLRTQDMPVVIKADGLAAGKGVIVAKSIDEADSALTAMLEAQSFGEAGTTVVIEDFLEGEEISFIAIVDGRDVVPMASSQDHKTRDDGDTGPNTGGMGAYSPAPLVDSQMHRTIMQTVMIPTVNALADEGLHYRGFLYAGLMIDESGQPKVLEFNCRFGDPETQPILFRLDSDLVDLCLRCFDGTLSDATPRWTPQVTVGVVMASAGYPGSYRTGYPISGLDSVTNESIKVFHAGTRIENGRVVTSGGRVLCVVASADTVSEARLSAYRAVEQIHWDGAFWRTDIGYRAVAREERFGDRS